MTAHPSALHMASAMPSRRGMTAAERGLWQILLGPGLQRLSVRRQVRLGPWRAPLLVAVPRAVIETDEEAQGLARKAWLMAQGYRLYRLPALAVLEDPEAVADLLRQELLGGQAGAG